MASATQTSSSGSGSGSSGSASPMGAVEKVQEFFMSPMGAFVGVVVLLGIGYAVYAGVL